MSQWTEEQNNAINVKGRAAIVSAAAGSGKTTVLVEKLVRLLTDPDRQKRVDADRIVVVTFTNDAAAQMKQRLTAAIAKKAAENPSDKHLLEQQAKIPSAKISTIHSFCFDLIRENSSKLGTDSGFAIIDEKEDAVISAKATASVMDRWFAGRPADIAKLITFFAHSSKNEESFAAMIPKLRDRLLALPFPEDHMDATVERYSKAASAADAGLINEPTVARYCENALDTVKKALVTYDIFRSLMLELYSEYTDSDGKYPLKAMDTVITNINTEKTNIENLIAAIEKDPLAVFSPITARKQPDGKKTETVFFTYQMKTELSVKDGPTVTFDAIRLKEIKDVRTKAKEAIESAVGVYSPDDVRSDFRIHADICGLLFGLIKDILAEERRIKTERNVLSFSDAEQLARALLCEKKEENEEEGEEGEEEKKVKLRKTDLAKELSDYYSIVMIDEFQDSTAVQELIFRMLSKDGSDDKPGTNFFAVGDIKQSIYRFRCADPSLFDKNLERSVAYADDGSTEPCKILLNHNFRSSQGVVDFVNGVFNVIMSEKNGSVDYGKDHELVQSADIKDDFGPVEIIEFCPVYPDEKKPDPADVTALEAEAVAKKIREITDTVIIHEPDGTERKPTPLDFCILLRASKQSGKDMVHIYVDALKKQGINAEGPAEESYLGSREIAVLIDLLRCIDNPTMDISMTAALMSPMFSFTAEDMARVSLMKGSSVYAKVCAAAEEGSGAPEPLKKLCADFCSTFGALREYAVSHSIEKLIWYIYDRTDLMAVMSVYKDSLMKKANLRLLPHYAADYDKNSTGGLDGFLRKIDSMIASEKDFSSASAAAAGGESVTVKTIHKSKGLEYPFVFLCDSWKAFNHNDILKPILFSANCGTAFKISDSEKLTRYESFPREAVAADIISSQRDEEMMLLYVALTRAKYKLFITRRTDVLSQEIAAGLRRQINDSSIKQDDAVSTADSMAGWLEIALDRMTAENENAVVFSQYTRPEAGEAPETAAEKAAPDAKALEQLRRNMTDDYDLTLASTASKLTVTQIAKKHSPEDSSVFRKKRTKGVPKGISAAAAGTAVHAFMQYADLRKLSQTPEDSRGQVIADEAERLCSLGLISSLEAKCVDPGKITAFLNDSICQRMMKSGEVLREKKFLIKISDMHLDDKELEVYNKDGTEGMLQGIADCVFEENGGYVLVDYKTDRNVDGDILADRYRKQLALYAAALTKILEKPVKECYLYSFDLGRSVKTEI